MLSEAEEDAESIFLLTDNLPSPYNCAKPSVPASSTLIYPPFSGVCIKEPYSDPSTVKAVKSLLLSSTLKTMSELVPVVSSVKSPEATLILIASVDVTLPPIARFPAVVVPRSSEIVKAVAYAFKLLPDPPAFAV